MPVSRRRAARPWIVPASLAAALLCVTPAASQTLKGLTLSVEGSQYKYEEPNNIVLDSDGPFIGVGAEYTQDLTQGWFARLHGRYATGEGKHESGGTVDSTSSDQTIWQGAIEIGRQMGFDSAFGFAPFIGIGYRHWGDKWGSVVASGEIGFDRDVDYLYLPVGLTTFWSLGDAWTVSLRGEFRLLLYGIERGELSDIPGVNFNLDNEFNEGYGLAAEVLVRKRLTDSFALAFGPFVRYWDISESNVDDFVPLVVPANTTVETGIVLKMNIGPPL